MPNEPTGPSVPQQATAWIKSHLALAIAGIALAAFLFGFLTGFTVRPSGAGGGTADNRRFEVLIPGEFGGNSRGKPKVVGDSISFIEWDSGKEVMYKAKTFFVKEAN